MLPERVDVVPEHRAAAADDQQADDVEAELDVHVVGGCQERCGELLVVGARLRTAILLDEAALGAFAPDTAISDDNRIKVICHLLGATKMQDITPMALERTYAALRKGNSPSGKKLSSTYVSDCAVALSSMMEDARTHGVIGENPCKTAKKPRRDTKEKKAIDQSQIRLLVAMLDCKDAMEVAVLLCAVLGLRRGEAVGLSWEDVDFENGIIHIAHSFDSSGNLRKTKTKAGDRIIPMSDLVMDALKERKEAQALAFRAVEKKQRELGASSFSLHQEPGTAVISNDYGQRITPSGLGHWWEKNRSRFGLEDYTLHGLRHSFVTNAILSGVSPSVVQDLAGHASPDVTMKIYTHVNMEAKRKAMSVLAGTY